MHGGSESIHPEIPEEGTENSQPRNDTIGNGNLPPTPISDFFRKGHAALTGNALLSVVVSFVLVATTPSFAGPHEKAEGRS